MKKFTGIIKSKWKVGRRYLRSFDLYKGFILGLSMLLAIVLGLKFGRIETGISLVIGMFVSAPSDVPGSVTHRVNGIIAALLLSICLTFIINMASIWEWTLMPLLPLLIFLVSFIAVFGFRASLVSFSGLTAIIMSLAHPHREMDLYIHIGLMGVGGLWYLGFSHVSHLLVRRSFTENEVAECMELTSKYLKTRGKLALEQGGRLELEEELFDLQTEINSKHEVLREILLSSRRHSGQSNFLRRQVVVFIELVDILELAIGNLDNVQVMQKQKEHFPDLVKIFTALIFEMAGHLDSLSKVSGGQAKALPDQNTIEQLILQAKEEIDKYSFQKENPPSYEQILLLQNIYDYFKKQAQKIGLIESVLVNLAEQDQVRMSKKDQRKFITQQDYDWKTVTENFNFQSPIFKLSLRMSITVLVGYIIGFVFPLQNPYWILLTIVVIMRPGYSLTRQRSKNRLYGTLIGGIVAVGIIYIIQNNYVYAALAFVTFVLGFSLVRKNFQSSAIFLTLNVVFLYALIQPDPLYVIQFRVLDTLIGAFLAVVANSFLWPAWGFLNIHDFFSRAIEANKMYLMEINNYYHHKNYNDPSYKLSRKEAFLAIGNLSAAFQEMTQEPKSKQKDLARVYELVVLNHTFLSLLASLGSYMRNNKTTEASSHFGKYIAAIGHNLDISLQVLTQTELTEGQPKIHVTEAQEYLERAYNKLIEQQSQEHALEMASGKLLPSKIQEVKLISDQLKWLYTLSDNMKKTARLIA